MTKKADELALIIRAQESEDWEDVAAIRNCPDVVYQTLQLPFFSRDAVRDKMENPPPGRHILVAVVENTVVGQLSLQLGSGRRAHMAHLGIMVHADYQRQGIGTALMAAGVDMAENWLGVTRIELEVFTDNEAALALYRRFGFEIEGTIHAQAFRAGQLVNAYLMARLGPLPQ